MMECSKCKQVFEEKWENKKTYKGIDRHHNPPEFLSDFLKEAWSGEFYNLCRDCHVELHKEIKQILFKNSTSLKFVNSEYWLMMKMTPLKLQKAKEEIYNFTKKWVGDNGNTKTT